MKTGLKVVFDVIEPDERVRYVVCDIRVRKPACEFFESAARVQSFVFRIVFGRDKSYRHIPCVDEKTENYLILGCGEIGKSENINVGVRKVVADARRKRFEPRGRVKKRFVQYFKIFFVNNTDVFQFSSSTANVFSALTPLFRRAVMTAYISLGKVTSSTSL